MLRCTKSFTVFENPRSGAHQVEWIEYLLLQSSLKVIKEIYRLFHHYHQQLCNLSGQQGRAVIDTVGGVLIGESRWAESNPYRSMLAAGLTAFSIKEYFRIEKSEVTVKAKRNRWTKVFTSIRYAVDRHVVVALEDKERFHSGESVQIAPCTRCK